MQHNTKAFINRGLSSRKKERKKEDRNTLNKGGQMQAMEREERERERLDWFRWTVKKKRSMQNRKMDKRVCE